MMIPSTSLKLCFFIKENSPITRAITRVTFYETGFNVMMNLCQNNLIEYLKTSI